MFSSRFNSFFGGYLINISPIEFVQDYENFDKATGALEPTARALLGFNHHPGSFKTLIGVRLGAEAAKAGPCTSVY